MNNTEFFKDIEERPLRMAVERELARPQIALRRAATPATRSEGPLPALVIVGLACWLIYAFMRTIPA